MRLIAELAQFILEGQIKFRLGEQVFHEGRSLEVRNVLVQLLVEGQEYR